MMKPQGIKERERRLYLYNKKTGKLYRGEDLFDRSSGPDEDSFQTHETRIWSTGKWDIYGNDVLEKDIVEFQRGDTFHLGVVHYTNGVTIIETNDTENGGKQMLSFDSVKNVRVLGNTHKYLSDEPLKSMTELCWSQEPNTAQVEAAVTSNEPGTYNTSGRLKKKSVSKKRVTQ